MPLPNTFTQIIIQLTQVLMCHVVYICFHKKISYELNIYETSLFYIYPMTDSLLHPKRKMEMKNAPLNKDKKLFKFL